MILSSGVEEDIFSKERTAEDYVSRCGSNVATNESPSHGWAECMCLVVYVYDRTPEVFIIQAACFIAVARTSTGAEKWARDGNNTIIVGAFY